MTTLRQLRDQMDAYRQSLAARLSQPPGQFDDFIPMLQPPPGLLPPPAPNGNRDTDQQFLDHLRDIMADRSGFIGFTPDRAREMVEKHPDILKQVDEYNEALKKQMEEQERNRQQMLDRLGIADCNTGDFALDLLCAMRGTTKSVLTAPADLVGDTLSKAGSSLLTNPLFILAAIAVGAYAIGQLRR